jgi:hypothetical protein
MALIDDALKFFQIAFDAILRGPAGIRHGSQYSICAVGARVALGIWHGHALADGEKKVGQFGSLKRVNKNARGSTKADPPHSLEHIRRSFCHA